MTDAIRQILADEAAALNAEAAVLRDDAMSASNPLEAISLSVTARRCEQRARDLQARTRAH
jgi:hypothetical protein